MNDDLHRFITNVKCAAVMLWLLDSEVAGRAGISQHHLSMVLNGKYLGVSVAVCSQIAAALGLELWELLLPPDAFRLTLESRAPDRSDEPKGMVIQQVKKWLRRHRDHRLLNRPRPKQAAAAALWKRGDFYIIDAKSNQVIAGPPVDVEKLAREIGILPASEPLTDAGLRPPFPREPLPPVPQPAVESPTMNLPHREPPPPMPDPHLYNGRGRLPPLRPALRPVGSRRATGKLQSRNIKSGGKRKPKKNAGGRYGG